MCCHLPSLPPSFTVEEKGSRFSPLNASPPLSRSSEPDFLTPSHRLRFPSTLSVYTAAYDEEKHVQIQKTSGNIAQMSHIKKGACSTRAFFYLLRLGSSGTFTEAWAAVSPGRESDRRATDSTAIPSHSQPATASPVLPSPLLAVKTKVNKI